MNRYDFHDVRWGITFLQTASQLDLEDRLRLMAEATLMYLNNDMVKVVQTDTYAGTLFTEGKTGIIGALRGVQYEAELETNSGKAHLKFLIKELTGAYTPEFSRN